jgi:YVTN family beta-propeller protein
VVDATLSVVKEVDLTPEGCSNPVAISQVPGGGNIYVACKGGGGVAVVTPNDNVLLPSVTGFSGSSPVWIDTSSDGKYTFVANQGSNTVSVICTSTDIAVCATGNAEVASRSVGGSPTFLKYDTHSQRVYVAGAGFVSVIDASGVAPTFNVLKTLSGTERTAPGCACPFGQTWVTALPDGTRFYVSDQADKSISVYSASNFGYIKTINLKAPDSNTTPIMIDSDKNSTKVYTANTMSNDFSIIKTSDDTEVFPGSTANGGSGRITAPLGAIPSPTCGVVGSATCRQTPTYVQVLP